ncbi:MAG: SPASM domain-containing protein [Acidobacteriota bacterium]|nr:MAG: SPASM domain-containing protein [Acidobacteriota bacterium]
MESIYYVATYLCHRTCHHCYEDRFRPYYGEDLRRVVDQSISNHARIIGNFPDRMTWLDLEDCDPATGRPREKTGRVILAGGEIMLEAVREPVLYSALDLLDEKYAGRVDLIVQTTGDLLDGKVLDELLEHHVRHVSVSGIDQHHQGLETAEARERQVGKLTRLFETRGMKPHPGGRVESDHGEFVWFSFFGATEESWIGPLWRRGRAQMNELSKATLADNFCNRWSGALNFLEYRYNGSEVSIEPNGNVFPCCIKTKAPIGNLLEEKLETILDRLIGNPVYEALSMGHPERMGISHGWSVEKFIEASMIRLPSGKLYQNFCIGCDRFHDEVLIPLTGKPVTIDRG